jgi:hypothetical protein
MIKFESGAHKRQKNRLFAKAAQSQRRSIDHFVKRSEPCSDSLKTELFFVQGGKGGAY